MIKVNDKDEFIYISDEVVFLLFFFCDINVCDIE